jgi:hypothetical protein
MLDYDKLKTMSPEALAAVIELANDVRDMMNLQRNYFSTRDKRVLREAKDAERLMFIQIMNINNVAHDRAEELKQRM